MKIENKNKRIEERQGVIYSTDVEGGWSLDIDLTLKKLSERLEIFEKNRFSGLEIKDKDQQFKGKVGFFGVDPASQQTTINDPSGGGDAGVDTPARTAINSLIDVLQKFGFIA